MTTMAASQQRPKAPEAPPAATKAPEAPAKAAAPQAPGGAESGKRTSHSFRRKMVGTVTSDKMSKTVVVEVNRYSLDPVYKKYVKRRTKYKAHDETNQYKVGDRVEIQEHRPLSREKRFAVVRLVARAVAE
jgi:small subunit ribosomal protein S17